LLKSWICLHLCITWSICLNAQDLLYSRAYGSINDVPLIFIHGGPGGNSSAFEFSIAQQLSEKGFYVIVYDQQGCGRSANVTSINYSLEQYLKDIDALYLKYNFTKAILLGHSWGGTLASFYANKHPEKVDKLILASSPLSYPAIFRTIREHCWDHYDDKGDVNGMQQMLEIRDMDTTSIMYISSIFEQAFHCGLYHPKVPSEQAIQLYSSWPDSVKSMVNNYSSAPVSAICHDVGFTSLQLSGVLTSIISKNVPIYGVYGDEDGLFDEFHIESIREIVGKDHMFILPQASHNIFLDKREEFIKVIVKVANAG
jgi:proline iminopeptidase